MLTITIPGSKAWDEASEEFKEFDGATLNLEHSLVSLSKWESKFEKPFLGDGEKTTEEVIAYIEAMILDPTFPPEVFSNFSEENLSDVNDYINAKYTATTFPNQKQNFRAREVITSELIYFWIVSYNIPWEVQYWHLNRLFTLIEVFNVKNQPQKKRTRAEMAAERQRLNAQRKAQFNTTG